MRCTALVRMAPVLVLLGHLAPSLAAQDSLALGIEDFINLPIVSDPQVTPDGALVAFTITTPSTLENRSVTKVWLADLTSGDSWQATSPQGTDRAPRWSPDGRTIAFISTRDGSPQIWRMPIRGGEAVKVTSSRDGIADFLWSPDSKAFYFWTDVAWGDTTEATRRSAPWGTEARIYTDLFYRHWNEWRLGVRSHLFRVEMADGAVTDVTPFDRDVPPLALGGRDVGISPVGTEIAMVFNPDSSLATSTNNDVFVMGPDGSARQAITTSKANDHSPQYSPDGRHIAYLAMATPGFESDRQQLMLYERASGRRIAVTPRWDLSISAFRWLSDARAVVAEVEERGGQSLYRIEVPSGRATRLVSGGTNSGVQVAARADVMVFLRSTARRAPEVWTAGLDGRAVRQVTRINDDRFSAWDIPALEEFGFVGAGRDSVFGWIMKPPGFDPILRYPLIYLIHGGPQGAWLDQWHARWNYATFAARGYVVAAVNFHGSTGYGQAFTNSVSRNWGGLPYDDLMKGLDILNRLPYVDSTRVGAAGASYGGYMVYWMAGHTNRFKALVAHDGIFNPLSMAGTTEELWFPLWEFGGLPSDPGARAIMEKWSPANFVTSWKTPMLVVHSARDYRVDLSEGLQAFTALRLRGVPGKFLYFPDEDHFVAKPRNRRIWWSTVLDWFDRYLRPQR
jgi:dipeptidyl aminopeptidase/acylaminoacyl peptidase